MPFRRQAGETCPYDAGYSWSKGPGRAARARRAASGSEVVDLHHQPCSVERTLKAGLRSTSKQPDDQGRWAEEGKLTLILSSADGGACSHVVDTGRSR